MRIKHCGNNAEPWFYALTLRTSPCVEPYMEKANLFYPPGIVFVCRFSSGKSYCRSLGFTGCMALV